MFSLLIIISAILKKDREYHFDLCNIVQIILQKQCSHQTASVNRESSVCVHTQVQNMLPRFSLDSADRNKVSSLRGIFSFNAGLALAILTPKLLAANGGEKVQASWTTVALIYGVLCLVLRASATSVLRKRFPATMRKTRQSRVLPI